MMARRLVAVFAAMLAVGCGGVGGGSSESPSSSTALATPSSTARQTTGVSAASPAVPIVVSQEMRESYEEPELETTVYLPVVSGIDPRAAAVLNATIESEVSSRVSTFRRGLEAAPPGSEGPPSSYVVSYEVTAATPRVLSVRFGESTYYQGAVSGNSGVFALTFDPVAGAVLALTDVIVEGGLPEVAVLVEHQLVADLYGGDEVALSGYASGITPDMLGHWHLSYTGVEVSFDAGVVASGNMGPVTVVVPYAELGDLIDPQGPAADLATG